MCKNGVKKLQFVIIFIPDQYKTKEMCDKVIIENGWMLDLFLTAVRVKTCVINLLIIIFIH